MKANNLQGEYCQNCAAILDDVQRNVRRVVVLDSQCASVFIQSGDQNRLDESVKSSSSDKPAKTTSEAIVHEIKPKPIEKEVEKPKAAKPKKR